MAALNHANAGLKYQSTFIGNARAIRKSIAQPPQRTGLNTKQVKINSATQRAISKLLIKENGGKVHIQNCY